jgi:toxin ParE1/3/4
MAERYRIRLSPEASADIHALHAYIAQDSPDNAADMVARIFASIDLLKTFPYRTAIQRQSKRVPHPVRTLPVEPYIVFFRVIDDQATVRILTVRHGARRRPRRFKR